MKAAVGRVRLAQKLNSRKATEGQKLALAYRHRASSLMAVLNAIQHFVAKNKVSALGKVTGDNAPADLATALGEFARQIEEE